MEEYLASEIIMINELAQFIKRKYNEIGIKIEQLDSNNVEKDATYKELLMIQQLLHCLQLSIKFHLAKKLS